VDERWFVPHFEKMLYDQGQLAISYLEAFQITHDAQYAAVARRIFDYVLRDMTDPAGGFHSAEDADSAVDGAQPNVKGEGVFYIWTAAEIRALVEASAGGAAAGGNAPADAGLGADANAAADAGLGADANAAAGAGLGADANAAAGARLGADANAASGAGLGADANAASDAGLGADANGDAQVCDWLFHRYGVLEEGNVANDPHAEFTGRNILYQANELEDTALHFGVSVEQVRAGLERAEQALLKARRRRPRPHLDDKVLTSWNGLMISALALGGAVLEEPRYATAARRAAEFLIARMVDPQSGILLRRYRQGDAAIPGFLDDYALFVQALLDLYETQFDRRHLDLAVRLTAKQRELFEDSAEGAFFSTAASDTALLLRVKEDYDGAEPSGNSVAAMNLLRLAQMTNRKELEEAAERLLAAFAPRLTAAPAALPQMLAACEFRLGQPRQIILVGDREGDDTRELLRTLNSRFVPHRMVLLVDSPEARQAFAAAIPAIAAMERTAGRASAYVCRNYTCQMPVSEAARFAELIQ
jgi:hypothetical protein